MSFSRYVTCLGIVFGLLLPACQPEAPPAEHVQQSTNWWKGNLHTHSLWSDGDTYPEMVVGWYHDHGYNFVSVSDHNVLAQGENWKIIVETRGGQKAFDAYSTRFGKEWVETRNQDGRREVRLKNFEEYRSKFETPGRFLVIPTEEISDVFGDKPIHLNAVNIKEQIEPRGGDSVLEVMQNNVDAVLEQRRLTGRAMFPILNHPNYGWALSAEDIIALSGEMFFEVYNGHPSVKNEGDEEHPGTERMWDLILTERLSRGDDPMFGVAVDDAHYFLAEGPDRSNPGRGWVMVRATELSAEAIIEAMEAADFYATSGVLLDDVSSTAESLSLTIRGEEGISYRTQFIGTRRVAERTPLAVEDIGIVLAQQDGLQPEYRFTGDEIYVRAKIVSSKLKTNPYREGDCEVAWTQPVVFR